MKRISFFMFVALVVTALTVPAFAAVQNVKVSGDITVKHIWRSALDLDNDNDTVTYNGGIFGAAANAGGATAINRFDDSYSFFMQQVRLRVDADMTDNIGAHIELLNQRDMDSPNPGSQGSTQVPAGGSSFGSTSSVGPQATNSEFNVNVSQAYIKVKEFLYSPLTLSVGRQNYQMGEGFIIGSRQVAQSDPQNSISADEFTLFNAFDSGLITLDLEPWALDIFYAKIAEDNIGANDDEDLFALNLGRSFSKYNSEFEVYFVASRNNAVVDGRGTTQTTTTWIQDYGLRGSIAPTQRLRLNGEAVMQLGEEGGFGSAVNGAGSFGFSDFTYNGNRKQEIRAFASDLRAELDITETPWPMTLGIEHVFYSGEDPNEAGYSANYRPLFRGKFHSAIREFQGTFYLPAVGATPSATNQQQFILDAKFHPFNNPDLDFMVRYLSFWFHHSPIGADSTPLADNEGSRSNHIGDELDFVLGWNYTEDLRFDLIYALFAPGRYFDNNGKAVTGINGISAAESNDVASELITSVTLNFG